MEPFEGLFAGGLFRGDRQGQTVDEDVFARDAERFGPLHDAFRDLKPLFRRLRDPVFVKGQSDDRGAVLFDERQDRRQALFLSVDGVDDGPAVVCPECRFKDVRFGAVDLERGVAHALDGLQHFDHHRLFIDLRQTDIDVEDLGTGLHLAQGLVQDVVDVVFLQGFFEQLLAGRVDPLSDDARPVDADDRAGAADDRTLVLRLRGVRDIREGPFQAGDVLRCGAAAPADQFEAVRSDAPDRLGEVFRPDVVFTAVRVRKPGVGLEDEGQVGVPAHALDDRFEVLRAKGTVDAERADAETGQGEGGSFCRDAGERAAVRLEGHGDEDRLAGSMFSRRQHGRLRFIEIGHGLDDDDVGFFRRVHLFREEIVSFFEREGTGRLEELTDGADVEGNEDIGAGSGRLRVLQRRFDDGVGRVAAPLEFVGVRAERIGVDEIGACIDVGSVE